LTVNISVIDREVTAHEYNLKGVADDVDSSTDDEDPSENNKALAVIFDMCLSWDWVKCGFLDGSIAGSADHSNLSRNWSRYWYWCRIWSECNSLRLVS
jgi:hypothetical protein